MGNCVGGFKKHTKKLQHRKKVRKIRICVLGLDGAGKSTVIRALASENILGILPTNGFTPQEFRYRKAEIIAYDLGGSERIRAIWKNYYPEVFGIIYVIDGSKKDRIFESGELLKDVISDKELSGKPLLIILNKVDQEGCIDEIQLTDRLNLHDLANVYRMQIRVEVCQSNMGTGKMMDPTLKDGFEWLLEKIYDDYEQLEKKVNEALLQLKRRQIQERRRRQHRLAATVSSSTTSEDKPNGGYPGNPEQNQVDEISSNIPVLSIQINANTAAEKLKRRSEASTRSRRLRAISPADGSIVSCLTNIEPGKMKYPEIFEVAARPTLPPLGDSTILRNVSHDKSHKMHINGTTDMDSPTDLQLLTKPIRGTQIIPLSLITSQQIQKGTALLRRVDSI